MRLAIYSALLLSVASHHVCAQEKQAFACAESEVGGFKMKGRSPEHTLFQRGMFTMVREGEWVILKWQEKNEKFQCSPVYANPDIVSCATNAYFMVIDFKAGRFTRSQMYSFIADSTDSLTVSYGTCQKF